MTLVVLCSSQWNSLSIALLQNRHVLKTVHTSFLSLFQLDINSIVDKDIQVEVTHTWLFLLSRTIFPSYNAHTYLFF